MNFYDENLKFFKDNIPILHEIIVNEKPEFKISLESVNETLNYIAVVDDKKCFIHSVFDINAELDNMFKKVDQGVKTLIIFGVGCGYSFNYIKKNFKNIKNILIVEPCLEMFKIFMSNLSIYEEIIQYDNVSFIVNKDVMTANAFLFEFISNNVTDLISIAYSVTYRTLFEGYYEQISDTLRDLISKTKFNFATAYYFREQWTRNSIMSMSKESILIDKIFNKFSSKSAIIVSAGPSLEKNIHLLKLAKHKALIAAVGTASKILESNGIKPHLRFAMDSQPAEKLIFDGITNDNSVLTYSDRVYHEIVPMFKRRLKLVLDVDAVSIYIYNRAKIKYSLSRSGFSIANTALDTLIKLGFENIIFVGQDLCYTKERLYAKGSWLESDKLNINDGGKKYRKLMDINGNEVYSDDGFIGMKSIFENTILFNPNINFINATEGGIGIDGTKIKSFQRVIDEDLINDYDFEKFFDDLFLESEVNNDSSKIYDIILELEDEIDKMIKINDSRIKRLNKFDINIQKGLTINKMEQEITYLNRFEEQLNNLDSYKTCIKINMDDAYKVIKLKNKYEGNDKKKIVLNIKSILETASCELKLYLYYFKSCIEDMKKAHLN